MKSASKDTKLLHHGDDFVMKVRGVLGGDECDLKGITVELNRAMRTDNEWLAILGVGGRPDARGNLRGNARSQTCKTS